jgi:hypothetical protein
MTKQAFDKIAAGLHEAIGYARGWNAAIEAAARKVHVEAEACIRDIVPRDEVGEREARARSSALLTAVDDIRAMARGPEQKAETEKSNG